MGLIAKQTGSDFLPVEAGTFQAICYLMVDLGTQQTTWNNEVKELYKICIGWEIPELRIEDKPRVISKLYTLSLSEKANLQKDLVTWRGKPFTEEELEGFDVRNVLRANCLLQVIHTQKDSKTYANVAAVTKLMKGMQKREPENPVICYSMTTDGFEIPKAIPEWLQKMIMKSKEYRAVRSAQGNPDLQTAQAANIPEPHPDIVEEEDDDIPF